MHQKESRVDQMIRMDQQSGKERSENHSNYTEKKKKQLSKSSLRDLWDNVKHINIHVTEVPEREATEKWTENLFEEITAENFLKLGKKRHSSSGSTESSKQGEPSKKIIQGYMTIKIENIKDKKKKIFKRASEKQLVMYV